jgi:hypothetical protein
MVVEEFLKKDESIFLGLKGDLQTRSQIKSVRKTTSFIVKDTVRKKLHIKKVTVQIVTGLEVDWPMQWFKIHKLIL